MTIYKINPDLLKPNGASNGDVITYVSANSRVEWAAPTGGGGDVANVWVNANDYVTYTTLTANIYNTFAYLNANVGGGGGGGITTGKAIAMAMIFGG